MLRRNSSALPFRPRILTACLIVVGACASSAAEPGQPPTLLAHVMPWYAAKPISGHWGWHWTMNHFDPDQSIAGRRQIASKLSPAIDPYDSSDPDVLEYHILLMKLSGIDGVIVDWYGLSEANDYAALHRNTTLLIDMAETLGLSFAICYEDRTVVELEKQGRLPQGRTAHAAAEIRWLAEHWFPREHYVHHAGQPLLLSFGVANLTDDEWQETLRQANIPIAYVSQAARRPTAAGVFDWPVPSHGIAAQSRFVRETSSEPLAIPVAFPRFSDIYEQAGVHASYGEIPDDHGRTFATTLTRAVTAGKPFVQIATWNDWGEGTSIEPSIEFGTRDLEVIQKVRRQHIDPAFQHDADDLLLPLQLLQLRRDDAVDPATLDRIALFLSQGDVAAAAQLIKSLASIRR